MATEDGFHLNIAIVTPAHAWDSMPRTGAPKFVVTHFARAYLGRDKESAIVKAQEFRARFTEGDKPGQFQLSLTEWQSTGQGVEF